MFIWTQKLRNKCMHWKANIILITPNKYRLFILILLGLWNEIHCQIKLPLASINFYVHSEFWVGYYIYIYVLSIPYKAYMVNKATSWLQPAKHENPTSLAACFELAVLGTSRHKKLARTKLENLNKPKSKQ